MNKEKEMFPLNLQIFGESDPKESEGTEPNLQPPKPEINVEEIIAKTTEALTEKFNKQKEDEIKAITDTFEEKLTKMQSESKEQLDKLNSESKSKEENFNKILEGLKTEKDTKDIIAEIEAHNEESKKSEEMKELLEAKQKAESEAKESKTALQEFLEKQKLKDEADKLEKEKLEFKAKLVQESKDKPYLEDKINKVLAEEDYETQKHDYMFLLKFFDTDEEKQKYEVKKKAGGSAFEGVVTNNGEEGSDSDLEAFSKKYIQGILDKAKGKRNPNRK